MAPKKVAIVGSGCSGLGALWALKRTGHEVHLYESNSRLGGHTNTVEWEGKYGVKTPVDTGFIVMNTATYPNFLNFLKHVGVEPSPTEMTFGVSRDSGMFEWAGTSLSAVFAQRRNLFSLRMWTLIFDIVRFNQFALDLLIEDEESENDPATYSEDYWKSQKSQETIGEYLDRGSYSEAFRDDYLLPMTAAVWSTSPDKCSLQFPAITLVRFMWNHHLLNTISTRAPWMTIRGGTNQYISAIMRDFPQKRVHLNAEVKSVVTEEDGKVTLTVNNERVVYDHVILATHGDQALDIIRPSATKDELSILSGFKTNRNVAILHSDLSLMPTRRIAWSAWNYITQTPKRPSGSSNVAKVCLTYCMNILQHIPETTFGNVLVTLNPLSPPDPRLIQGIWEYSHPLYNEAAIRGQKLLPKIQNVRGVSYCGAWTKYGFHEDGFSSGLSVAINHLGAELPFKFVDSTFSRGKKPELTVKNTVVRMVIAWTMFLFTVLGWVLGHTPIVRHWMPAILESRQQPIDANSGLKSKKLK